LSVSVVDGEKRCGLLAELIQAGGLCLPIRSGARRIEWADTTLGLLADLV
jgi:hypothetical protein